MRFIIASHESFAFTPVSQPFRTIHKSGDGDALRAVKPSYRTTGMIFSVAHFISLEVVNDAIGVLANRVVAG